MIRFGLNAGHMTSLLQSHSFDAAGRPSRRGRHFSGLLTLAMLAGLSSAHAQTTYTVLQRIGKGSVKGTIVTDGKKGRLAASDIIGWSLTLDGPGATVTLTNANSVVFLSGHDLSATAKHLIYNYNGKDDGFLVFQEHLYSGAQYWCNAVTTQNFDCAAGASVVPQTIGDKSAQYAARTGKGKIAKD